MKYKEWRDILQKEEKTHGDVEMMERDSAFWNTCAVGAKFICDLEKSGLLPKSRVLASSVIDLMDPCDHILNEKIFNLGHRQFLSAIECGDWKEALRILDKIYNTTNIYKSVKYKMLLLNHIVKI